MAETVSSSTLALCDESEHTASPRGDQQTPPAKSVDLAAGLFRALGDSARLRLMIRLIEGELCVGDLALAEGESMPAISQRLRVLRLENIVVRRRQGKHIKYALADHHITQMVLNALAHADEAEQSSTGKEEDINE
ncbi:MAG TPA: metalloregulator ArsR/SmtB family transcription factor [Bryobacteraceae bacterium]|nr:metalloregulator ArsR/SmtB family transcription factor [Bryobacteraceae bacterium]